MENGQHLGNTDWLPIVWSKMLAHATHACHRMGQRFGNARHDGLVLPTAATPSVRVIGLTFIPEWAEFETSCI